jgi:hypothetical protein
MTWGSTAPQAIQTIVAALQAALPGVVVQRGPVVSDDPAVESVSVAYAEGADPAVEGSFTDESRVADKESYVIRCVIGVRNGDADVTAAENRAFELLGAVGTALRANHTLNDLVLLAHPGDWSMPQEQNDLGATAALAFDIDIDAYTIIT